MIILTLTSGVQVYVDPDHIQTTSRPGDRTDITLTGAEYPVHVRETPAEIARLVLALDRRAFFLTETIRSEGLQITAFSLGSSGQLTPHYASMSLESVH